MVLLWLQQNSFRKCDSLHQSPYYFFIRPEIQMSSEEGLNAYGAVTWGQFFIYQGFNENCGWMHTSTNVDVADMYAEKLLLK
jgi:acyl-homoserine lactone acylase PvdQ